MARKKQSRGECVFCSKELSKSGLTRHLAACSERKNAIDVSLGKKGKKLSLYHLQVQDAFRSDYWLHLETKESARLEDLDRFLRAIWLECCGHMSEFSIGGWGEEEISMNTRVADIFEPGIGLTHIYDFGTSSETIINVLGTREGKPLTPHPIALMARNNPPEEPCIECGQPASWLCMECLIELDTPGALCDRHVEDHPHEDYGDPVKLVNSPRMGMCGYEGPAEPPY